VTEIPKIIHYCWFGHNPKPKSFLKYIEGWKKNLPEYEIMEWNEGNFDVNICTYTKEAYEAKKYAFVSDYARLLALYNHGGIYLDTDVEVFKDLKPLLNIADCIFGFEEKEYVATSTMLAKPKQVFIKQFLNSYHQRHFVNDDKSLDMKTNVEVLTEMLSVEGLVCDGTSQTIDVASSAIVVLPQEYLSPYDYINCYDKLTDNSYTKHHFEISWGKRSEWINKKIKTVITRYLGPNFLNYVRDLIK